MKIAPDKTKHFIVGIAMGFVVQGVFCFLLDEHLVLSAVLSFILVLAISYGFELYSKLSGRGHYEIMDAVFSAAGGFLGMIIFDAAILIFM